MNSILTAIRWRFDFLQRMTQHVGLVGAVALRIAEDWNRVAGLFGPRWRVQEVHVRPKGYLTSVAVRLGSSDFRVFEQVFVLQQYMPTTVINDPNFIVDCGANVGYSALFFLKHFPRARVIAVEPDHQNAELCRRNVRFYSDRITVVEKAIWSKLAKLEFVKETRKPGEEWGIQVQEATADAATDSVEAIDISNLMALTGIKYIDLLKIDIEKSESEVFRSNPEEWLDRVGNIAIELHGSGCSAIFRSAMSRYSFRETESGDVTVCLGLCPRLVPATPPEGARHV